MKRALLASLLLLPVPVAAADWTHWRGETHTGASPEKGLPVRWSATDNVAWATDLPGHAAGSPIVVGPTVFVAAPEGGTVQLYGLDRATGKVRFKAPMGPAEGHAHKKHNMATPSPASDGQRIVTMTGTGFLKAFDLGGRELWSRDIQKDYGAFGLMWGYSSSPLLVDGGLYLQVLHGTKTDDPSYVLRIDPLTGKTVWRVERKTGAVRESPDAYSTPVPVRVGGRLEIVVTGGDAVTGHDPKSGAEVWRAEGLNPDQNPVYRIVASPLVVGDLVITPTRVKPMVAWRTGGKGDISTSHRAWSTDLGPDVPTPTSDGTHLYSVNDKGILTCFEARTGRVVYGPQRLAVGAYSASPVVADGKVYAISEEGVTSVFKAGATFELLAENALGDVALASPAIAGGKIFLRTSKKLYAIGRH